jgi:hypothetical protein
MSMGLSGMNGISFDPLRRIRWETPTEFYCADAIFPQIYLGVIHGIVLRTKLLWTVLS